MLSTRSYADEDCVMATHTDVYSVLYTPINDSALQQWCNYDLPCLGEGGLSLTQDNDVSQYIPGKVKIKYSARFTVTQIALLSCCMHLLCSFIRAINHNVPPFTSAWVDVAVCVYACARPEACLKEAAARTLV